MDEWAAVRRGLPEVLCGAKPWVASTDKAGPMGGGGLGSEESAGGAADSGAGTEPGSGSAGFCGGPVAKECLM